MWKTEISVRFAYTYGHKYTHIDLHVRVQNNASNHARHALSCRVMYLTIPATSFPKPISLTYLSDPPTQRHMYHDCALAAAETIITITAAGRMPTAHHHGPILVRVLKALSNLLHVTSHSGFRILHPAPPVTVVQALGHIGANERVGLG